MRCAGVVSFLLLLAVPSWAAENVIKDAKGKVLAVLYDCNSCREPSPGRKCASGVEEGFHDGKACGKCLIDANFGARIGYASDLILTGSLKDEDGRPLKGSFVKLSLPNTWNYRTRTVDNGYFQLTLGATQDRQGDTVRVDLGPRTLAKDHKGDYLLFLLPEGHKPCAGPAD